ncbi:MAG: NADH-quinone oxidoreductase subunit M, partial [Bacteroidota bacterium]|nr:NADH-quinone oxidoreductase subunit M [Bacteroidota bacterium]
PHETQRWLFWAFALSFCIKVPLFPLHTWLPDAHVEAPTAGSVILAGVLLKMGTYGLIRFNLELFPQASFEYATLLAWLGVVGILYGALVAFAQSDMKKLIAYSSVSHLGFIVLGIFSMTVEGLQGALIQMVNHGLSTGMLFLCVGLLYERRHTRELAEFGGLARIMPLFALLLAFAVLSSVGLPGLNGFIGEFLSLLGAARSRFLDNFLLVILGACGVILAAVYLLKFYHATMFGQPGNPANYHLRDLNWLERVQLVPLVLLFIGIGVYPRPFLQTSEVALRGLVAKLEQLRFGTTSTPTPSPLQPVPREQQPQPTPGAPDPQKLLEEQLRRMPPPRP